MSQFVVKIFVGVEYECPRGHRFMLASPDKVLRATAGKKSWTRELLNYYIKQKGEMKEKLSRILYTVGIIKLF